MLVQTLTPPPRRLRILGEEEIDALYGLPHFTDEERLEYFSLTPPEKAALEPFHSIKSRICFILGIFAQRLEKVQSKNWTSRLAFKNHLPNHKVLVEVYARRNQGDSPIHGMLA